MRINKDLPVYIRLMVAGLLILIGVLTIIASAEQKIWVKRGTTKQDYNRDNYACMKESQARYSSSSSDRFSGSSSSGVTTNTPMYNACMEVRGWTLEEDKTKTWEGIHEQGEKDRAALRKKAEKKKQDGQ